MQERFDYVIIGGGSAGCVLANRLSADPAVSVLLLEAGPEPRSPWIRIPGGVAKLFQPNRHTIGYSTEPEPHLNERRIYWPRGRGLGGTSAINGMIYLRGHPHDYDRWRQMGNVGWGWDDVLPLFERSIGCGIGAAGDQGRLRVSDPSIRHRFSELFVEAAERAGWSRREDFNSGEQEGVGFLQFTIGDGMRCSSYDAFLAAIRHRGNLTIRTGAQAERIRVEHGRATGVVYRLGNDRRVVDAAGEIILCGGAINSPQLLMLSGIGPASDLRDVGVDVIRDLPAVGRNLHDHTYASLVYSTLPRYSMNAWLRWPRLALAVGRYAMGRKGKLSLGASQTCLFAKVMDDVEQPDVQITTRALSMTVRSNTIVVEKRPAVTASVCLLRPESRGAITLQSPRIEDAPLMRANYLETARDQRTTMAGLRLIERIMASPLMRDFRSVSPLPADDDALLSSLRGFAGAVMHPVGSCRMGADADSVVDPSLKVRGIDALRVADASIMPDIVSANTNAASIMIGEKAAEMITKSRRAALA